MKKRFLTFILTIATMLMCIFGFSACGGNVEFKINFVVENEVYATISTSGNEVISMPENPTKDDYTFDGWYWDENTWEKPFTANSLLDAPLSSDMKVYAKFNKNHTHEYTPTTTEPTCTEKGIITYTCTCGDSYTEDISAIGHDEKTHQAKAPTCTEIGWEEYVTCEREGCEYSTYKEIPATGVHTWDDGKITTEPTCTEKGVKTFTCTVCETTTYTEDVEALKHDEKTHQAKAPTCTEIGWEEYVTCERKGCEYSTYKEIPATGVHTWDKGEETKAPTCTKEGEITYTCTVCKTTTKTEPIDKLPHEHNTEKWSSNATYHWHECSCGDKADEEKHTAGAPATATTPQTCTVCGYVLQVETGILFNTLTVNGTNVYGKVSNDTEIFSFINEITVKGNATYVVDVNISCKDPIESKTVELSVGDNKFYVLEKIGNNVKLFTVTIRRRPMYDVTFDVDGGMAVEKQIIEEDSLAVNPKTEKVGYHYVWDYNFNTPITKDTAIKAIWSPNTDTKYTVNYYWQNLNDNYYSLHETDEPTGTSDTTAMAVIKEYEHFTYNASKSTVKGNINPDGSQVLSVYYTRDTYGIITDVNNTKAGTSTKVNGNYRFDKEFTLTATTNAGYTFLGWYDGENLVCESEEFTFKAEKDVTYTATWSANTDTKYTVNYYWQNIDDDEYTLHEAQELTGTTDTPTAEVDIRRYQHFTYNAGKSIISGNIDGDGNRQLRVYYTRDSYTITTYVNDETLGYSIGDGVYRYGKEITLSAHLFYLGYANHGWNNSENIVSTNAEYTFTVDKDEYYSAILGVATEMLNFEFESTEAVCEITGIYDETVTEIIIPNYVTSIAVEAFYYCESLTSVKIPDSVTSIGNYAFYGCSNLTSVEIGDGVENIGYCAFEYTKYYNNESNWEKGVLYIGKYLIKAKTSISNAYAIKAKTVLVAPYAFEDCTSLRSIEIPDSITNIGSSAFSGCISLTNIEIPDSVTSIGSSAFSGCISLTNIEIPDSVTSIGHDAFYYCYNLTDVYITDIVAWCNISFGEYSTILGDYNTANPLCYAKNLYLNNELVTELVIPDGATKIGTCAFYEYSYLTSVKIPNSVVSIDDGAFANCSSLTNIEIPNSVVSIGKGAFANCSSLTSVEIPNSVVSIGKGAFMDCSKLTEMVLPFVGATKDGTSYTYLGYIFDVRNSDMPVSLKKVTITGGAIGKGSFQSCDYLTSVVIGDGVTSIGDEAFSSCDNLTSVVIGNGVTSIGNSAFSSCISLTSIEIPDSVTSIGVEAFYCSSLMSITFKVTSTWYRTTSSSNWNNKTGGTKTSVISTSQNATYFKSTYYNYYWYKK